MAEILVFGELSGGRLEPASYELLAAARGLGGEVAIAILGDPADGVSGDAVARGADRVYLVQDPLLAEASVDMHVAAFEQVCRRTAPRIVLVGRTPAGRDIAPRVAFRLEVGLAQDCVEVETDPDSGRAVATRPVFGGNAMAKVTFQGEGPSVILVRERAYEPLDEDVARKGEVVEVGVKLDRSMLRVRRIKTVRRASEGVRLEDASVVVSGGRGLGGPEPFEMLAELAELLGGALGASRAACDAGWLDHSHQVGLTGKTVTPELYIAVGVSGASQHMAGCSGSRNIVAVNKDQDANIFKEAAYGVAGDWRKVMPAFIETVRELVGPR